MNTVDIKRINDMINRFFGSVNWILIRFFGKDDSDVEHDSMTGGDSFFWVNFKRTEVNFPVNSMSLEFSDSSGDYFV